MICRDEAEVIGKLCDLADKFNELYSQKKYLQAMHTYSNAITVALFMEADRDIMNFLFGMSNTEETDEKGLFNRDRVTNAQWMCIKHNQSFTPVYVIKNER